MLFLICSLTIFVIANSEFSLLRRFLLPDIMNYDEINEIVKKTKWRWFQFVRGEDSLKID